MARGGASNRAPGFAVGRRRGGTMNLEGGCACRTIRYKLTHSPLIVHACHCRDCQRLTGSAFVVNIWIEKKFVEPGPVAPKSFRLAGGSGKHNDVFFCETCGRPYGAVMTLFPATACSCAPGHSMIPRRLRP